MSRILYPVGGRSSSSSGGEKHPTGHGAFEPAQMRRSSRGHGIASERSRPRLMDYGHPYAPQVEIFPQPGFDLALQPVPTSHQAFIAGPDIEIAPDMKHRRSQLLREFRLARTRDPLFSQLGTRQAAKRLSSHLDHSGVILRYLQGRVGVGSDEKEDRPACDDPGPQHSKPP